MIFEPLTLDGALAVLPLREKYRAALRTGGPVNRDDQETWHYRATAQGANSRWWQCVRPVPWDDDERADVCEIIGYCGIEKIDWIARTGELSLLLDGSDDEWNTAFDHLLDRAFNELGLREVHAEVYHCSPDRARWLAVAVVFKIERAVLPMRKFHDGRLWDADWLSWRLPS